MDMSCFIVSILVLMDLCIKTSITNYFRSENMRFNPCFNGSMYKNHDDFHIAETIATSFNPCFNGSMYKNNIPAITKNIPILVSILVLMDLCIKTPSLFHSSVLQRKVSILVLMDLCIKT